MMDVIGARVGGDAPSGNWAATSWSFSLTT